MGMTTRVNVTKVYVTSSIRRKTKSYEFSISTLETRWNAIHNRGPFLSFDIQPDIYEAVIQWKNLQLDDSRHANHFHHLPMGTSLTITYQYSNVFARTIRSVEYFSLQLSITNDSYQYRFTVGFSHVNSNKNKIIVDRFWFNCKFFRVLFLPGRQTTLITMEHCTFLGFLDFSVLIGIAQQEMRAWKMGVDCEPNVSQFAFQSTQILEFLNFDMIRHWVSRKC